MFFSFFFRFRFRYGYRFRYSFRYRLSERALWSVEVVSDTSTGAEAPFLGVAVGGVAVVGDEEELEGTPEGETFAERVGGTGTQAHLPRVGVVGIVL